MDSNRKQIFDLVCAINPLDDLERQHKTDILSWIEKGLPLFRLQKPDIPIKHLVSYFVVYDPEKSKILLVDHKKAGLWLPPGGHVEIDEHPKETVDRECLEELGCRLPFLFEGPLFLTVTETVGMVQQHTDVSFWYVLEGKEESEYIFDQEEFHSINWFKFDEIPCDRTDPHMERFLKKLQTFKQENDSRN